MKYNSEECRNKLINSLQDLSNNVNNMYFAIREELENEILDRKANIEKVERDTNEVYSKLTPEICVNLIKKKLPLRIKLISRIKWRGHSIISSKKIKIYFAFSENGDIFNYDFYADEINLLAKLNVIL